MHERGLTVEQKRGIRLGILVNLLVLVLFLILLVTGRPIAFFGSLELSATYAVLIYLPVIVLSLLAFRRLRA